MYATGGPERGQLEQVGVVGKQATGTQLQDGVRTKLVIKVARMIEAIKRSRSSHRPSRGGIGRDGINAGID
jgi:hypothetical protein